LVLCQRYHRLKGLLPASAIDESFLGLALASY
jgi:hypothetical protein